jgi:hypothetical protein
MEKYIYNPINEIPTQYASYKNIFPNFPVNAKYKFDTFWNLCLASKISCSTNLVIIEAIAEAAAELEEDEQFFFYLDWPGAKMLFQMVEALMDHHKSIVGLFDISKVEKFDMDLRVQLNAFIGEILPCYFYLLFNLENDKPITVNWNIETMKKYLNPDTFEFNYWTEWKPRSVPPPENVKFTKRRRMVHWPLYGTKVFCDLAGMNKFVYLSNFNFKKVHYDGEINEVFLYDDQSRIWRYNNIVDKRLSPLNIGLKQIEKENKLKFPNTSKEKINKYINDILEDTRKSIYIIKHLL